MEPPPAPFYWMVRSISPSQAILIVLQRPLRQLLPRVTHQLESSKCSFATKLVWTWCCRAHNLTV